MLFIGKFSFVSQENGQEMQTRFDLYAEAADPEAAVVAFAERLPALLSQEPFEDDFESETDVYLDEIVAVSKLEEVVMASYEKRDLGDGASAMSFGGTVPENAGIETFGWGTEGEGGEGGEGGEAGEEASPSPFFTVSPGEEADKSPG